MRRPVFIPALLLMTGSAGAAEIVTPSKVDAVTVFMSGAEVTRIGKAKLDKGEHVIVFTDVPAGAVPGSIRVEGKATGKLDIGSVDTRRTILARAESQAADAERKKFEEELDQLRDQKSAVESQVQATETQKSLIANLAQLPTRPAPASGSAGQGEDWPRVLALIGQGTSEAAKVALEAQIRIRDLDHKIEDAENKLTSLAPAKTEQTEVKVYVEAAAPLEADLTIRYQVADAHWTPLYDARLQTGSKTAAPKLELVRRAAITQKSGESWDNVTLQLSTARPSAGAAAPEIYTQTIDFEPDAPKPVAMSAPAPAMRRMLKDKADGKAARDDDSLAEQEISGGMAGAAPPAAPEPAAERQTAVAAAPFEATFAVAGKISVPGTGDAKRVVLLADQIEPALSVRTVPKYNPKAFLYAKLMLAKGTPLLPGQVYLFRDGTFIGTGALPLLAPGEEHDLGFGADDQVKVRYAIIEEKRGETGLITSSHTDSHNFRVTVKNMHERPISVTVLDQMPVAQNQDIKVEYTGKAQPAKQNIDDKRGVISFEQKLEPDDEKVLDFGYRITWPAAKSLIYGGR